MKSEIMAQFLIPGDIILVSRKKREIVQSSTTGNLTRIAYEDLKGNIQIVTCDKSEFIMVVNSDHVLDKK